MNLHEFLSERSGEILEEAEAAVGRARLEHYEAAGRWVTRQRMGRLLELSLECVRSGHVTPMVEHASRVARERFEAGFALHEVQTAFNVLEEALWSRILQGLPLEEQVPALGRVSTILGAGKDVLAREYVARASLPRPPALDTGALMKGT